MKSLIPLAALMGTALSGCFVGVDDRGRGSYPDDAIFAVEWRIDGSRSPAACFDFGVDAAYVTIESRFGTEQEATVNCEDFAIDFYVEPGDYWATVELLDRTGRPISSVVETREMPLYAGDDEYVVAEFPPDAFF
jgi:hypothetical protein